MARPFERNSNALCKRAAMPEGMAHLEGENSNLLFETLETWNEHLKSAGIDPGGLSYEP